MKKEYVIDGLETTSLDAFFEEFSRKVIPGAQWGHNLNALNDVLRGGFGTAEEGFTLRWINSTASKEFLGYPETVRQLQATLQQCHPTSRDDVDRQLQDAQRKVGPTVFDWLVEIILIHGSGGREADDNVSLLLE